MPTVKLTRATIEDYNLIQNMARFYVYDMSRFCGQMPGWEIPKDGLYECFDFKKYITDDDRDAFLVTVSDEIAGFVLLNKRFVGPTQEALSISNTKNKWNMGEFFILAKFQRHGIGKQVLKQLFKMIPGYWEVTVIPENKPAISFWKNSIKELSEGQFTENTVKVTYDSTQPNRVVFNFIINVDKERD